MNNHGCRGSPPQRRRPFPADAASSPAQVACGPFLPAFATAGGVFGRTRGRRFISGGAFGVR